MGFGSTQGQGAVATARDVTKGESHSHVTDRLEDGSIQAYRQFLRPRIGERELARCGCLIVAGLFGRHRDTIVAEQRMGRDTTKTPLVKLFNLLPQQYTEKTVW
jgi:hypothetical protein